MFDPKNLTVQQFVFKDASKTLLHELAAESEYWDRCKKFIDENIDKTVGSLSFKQRDWLIKIKESLIEEAGNVD